MYFTVVLLEISRCTALADSLLLCQQGLWNPALMAGSGIAPSAAHATARPAERLQQCHTPLRCSSSSDSDTSGLPMRRAAWTGTFRREGVQLGSARFELQDL